jgi:6-pyruvoyl-tetrahydropterin synthase
MFAKQITITYEVVQCAEGFAVIKAYALMPNALPVQTFGSALYGGKVKDEYGKFKDVGSTTSRYVIEIAEKRAMSRVVLKITNLYSEGVYGEDEVDDIKDFSTPEEPAKKNVTKEIFEQMKAAISAGKSSDVKKRLKDYILSPQQHTELNKLIGASATETATLFLDK